MDTTQRHPPPPDIIFMQDTQIHADAEIQEQKEQWDRVWKRQNMNTQLSYWTTTITKSAGLGILVSPELNGRIKPWQKDSWISRIMAVEFDMWLLVNIYAPTSKVDQDHFFQDLEQ